MHGGAHRSLAPSSRPSQREHNIVQVAVAPLRLGLDGLRWEAPSPCVLGAVRQHKARRLRHRPGVDRDGVCQQWPLLGRHGRARQDLMVYCWSWSSHSRSLRWKTSGKKQANHVCSSSFPGKDLLTGAKRTPLKS